MREITAKGVLVGLLFVDTALWVGFAVAAVVVGEVTDGGRSEYLPAWVAVILLVAMLLLALSVVGAALVAAIGGLRKGWRFATRPLSRREIDTHGG